MVVTRGIQHWGLSDYSNNLTRLEAGTPGGIFYSRESGHF